MRLRRQIFDAQVWSTAERARPITIRLAGLSFDLDPDEACKLASQLIDAIATARQDGCRPFSVDSTPIARCAPAARFDWEKP